MVAGNRNALQKYMQNFRGPQQGPENQKLTAQKQALLAAH